MALSLALNGASAGGFTVTPLLARLAQQIGLSPAAAVLVLACVMVLLLIIVVGISNAASLTRCAAGASRLCRPT